MCENLKDQFHQETGQDQVNSQDSSQETLQNSALDQKVDQSQHTNQEQTLEQIFKDKNVGISTLNIVINNNGQEQKESIQWEGNISGRVLDSETAQPLIHKRMDVFFASTAGYPIASVYTDEVGGYKIPDLPPGFYTLRVYPEELSFTPTDVVNVKVVPQKQSTQDIMITTAPYRASKVRF
ncbi:MAG: carboxypeptidase regulatory-like domain-containing protein [Clostridia bacterium]|nr:carboxypeptidase regulatory-like domain-containing protein [Clostridia bacterium]